MIRRLLLCLLAILLSSCAVNYNELQDGGIPHIVIQSASVQALQSDALRNIPPAVRQPVVAVYPNSLQDLTGARASNGKFALFASAITQAPEAYLIRALKHTSNGAFFRVVERVGLDSLTKERQLIRNTRENFEEDSALKPLLLAGLLMQGAVVSYNANEKSGGVGARYLGIGGSKEWREDSVSVSLRLVSVSTGEVLIEVLTKKKILSVALSQDVFRFLDENAKLIEIEGGVAENESTAIALQKAIEAGVYEMIMIGKSRGYWDYE